MNINIGKKIADRRKELGMTQEALAARLGVDRSTVTKWETGFSNPTAAKLPKLAAILNCTVDELLREAEA